MHSMSGEIYLLIDHELLIAFLFLWLSFFRAQVLFTSFVRLLALSDRAHQGALK